MTEPIIRLEKLTFTYPEAEKPILNAISLSIVKGEFVLLAGPSGGGKSTFLRCLNGLVPHFTGGSISGSLSVNGLDPMPT